MPSTRRNFIVGATAGLTTLSAGCTSDAKSTYAQGTSTTTEWRFPDYDRRSTAYNPDALGPRNGISNRWSAPISGARTRPVVANETVYVATVDGLTAFNLATGSRQWTFAPTDQPWTRPPTVSGGTVYVGMEGKDGLWALDPKSGDVQWSLDTRGSIEAGVFPSPDGKVVYTGDDTGRLYVINKSDGTVKHTHDVIGEVTALATPAHRYTVVVGTNGGQVYEFYDSEDVFYPLWQRRIAGGVQDIAVTEDGSVVVSAFGNYTYELRNGAHAGTSDWRANFTANDFVVTPSHVIGMNLAQLAEIKTREGKKQWTKSGNYGCAPAGAGDTFYVGATVDDSSPRGYLAAYPLGEGGGLLSKNPNKRWHHSLDGTPVGGLTIADGALITVTSSENGTDKVHVFDPA